MLKLMDKNLIEQYIKDGWLRRQWNKDKTLQVLDYTQQTTYANKWDGVTETCRGLVLDNNYHLVMPCMSKFFNFEQLNQKQQEQIFYMFEKTMYTFAAPLITKKYDGCLAAIFPYKGNLIISSKCSFDSFVVDAVKDIINNQLSVSNLGSMSLGLICEVIHPKTHILVDYGNTKELRVITSFDLYTFMENSFEDTERKVNILKLPYLKMVEQQKDMDLYEILRWKKEHDASEEGFVVRFNNNMRVKFKSEQYLNCAKAVHHISYSSFVKYILENYDKVEHSHNYWWKKILNKHISHLPDEFQKEAEHILSMIELNYEYWFDKIFMLNEKVKILSDKEIGLKTDDKLLNQLKGLVFKYRKNKNIDRDIFKIILEEDKEVRKNANISV